MLIAGASAAILTAAVPLLFPEEDGAPLLAIRITHLVRGSTLSATVDDIAVRF